MDCIFFTGEYSEEGPLYHSANLSSMHRHTQRGENLHARVSWQPNFCLSPCSRNAACAVLFCFDHNPVRRESFRPPLESERSDHHHYAEWVASHQMSSTHNGTSARAWETARISRGEIDCTRRINSRCWQITNSA
jgi:hypothetical protein